MPPLHVELSQNASSRAFHTVLRYTSPMPTLQISFRLLRPVLSCFFIVGVVFAVAPAHALPTGEGSVRRI
ncbi:MAG: hypothetical protein GY822_32855 [Deltaproteobacteria bacterium]|nr:hypothetical protein [Deltaproteobacteria bacterium]